MDIREKALLVNLRISQWTGAKQDNSATSELHAQKGAEKEAGRYRKNLISPNAFKGIKSSVNEIRKVHKEWTLAWEDNGIRLLPSKLYMEYASKMRELKAVFDENVDRFINGYSSAVCNARQLLGGLYNPDDYPSEGEIRSLFDCKWDFRPIPSKDDFRISVKQEELDEIKRSVQESQEMFLKTSLGDLWDRMFELITHMGEQLSNPRAIIQDRLMEKLENLGIAVKKLNIFDDPHIEEVRQKIVDLSTKYISDELRQSPETRTKAAKEVEDITNLMSEYMGG